MTAPFRLDAKTALVTGGASGIGEATCRAFAAAGASVAIVDVNRPAAEELSRELPGSSVLTFDITEEADVCKALATRQSLDILVNNANIGLVGNVEAMTPQLWVDDRTQIRVNFSCPGTVDTPFVERYLEKYHRNEKDRVRA